MSRFIKEIPIDLIEVVEEESASTRRSFGGQKEKYNRPITNEFNTKKQSKQRAMRPQTTGAETKSWQTGDKANHKVWGIGTVVSVQGEIGRASCRERVCIMGEGGRDEGREKTK